MADRGIYPKSQQLTITVSFSRDRFRTMINVLGDALAAGIMAHICRKEFIKDGDEVTALWAGVCQGGLGYGKEPAKLPQLVPPVHKRGFRERTELGNGQLSTWGGGIFFHEVMWKGTGEQGLQGSCVWHTGWEQQKQLHCVRCWDWVLHSAPRSWLASNLSC